MGARHPRSHITGRIAAGAAACAIALTACSTPTADDGNLTTRSAYVADEAPAVATTATAPFAANAEETIIFTGPDLGPDGQLEFSNGATYEIPLSVQINPGAISKKHDVAITVSRTSGPYPIACRQTASVPLLNNVGTVNLRCSGTFGTDGQRGHDQSITVLVHQEHRDGTRRTVADGTITLAVTTNNASPAAPATDSITRTDTAADGSRISSTLTTPPAWLLAGVSNTLTWTFTRDRETSGAATVTISVTDRTGRDVNVDCPPATLGSGETTIECRITPQDARDLIFTPTWTFPGGTQHTQDPTGPLTTTW